MRRQAGISIIELIMFILIVSVGIAGILSVMNYTSSRSEDPLIQKQALAIAESLMEEITLQPFTFCDPDDEKVTEAENSGECTIVESMGPEAGEARTSISARIDNVNDYHGLTMNSGIVDLVNGTVVTGLEDYAASVNITQQAVGSGVTNAQDSLRIDVTVTHSAGVSITLTGYRLRYAPNAT